MSWNTIIGQQRVKQLLQRSIDSNRIAHSYIFYGPEGVGKDALAIEFAKTLQCQKHGHEACDECPHCKKMSLLQYPDTKLIFALPVGKGESQGDHPISVLTENQISEIREQIDKKSRDPYYHLHIEKANFIKINSIRDIKKESSLTQNESGRKIIIILDAELMNTEAMNSLLKTLEEPLQDTIFLLTTSAKDQLLPTILSRCQMVRCDILSEEEIKKALIERDGADVSSASIAAQLANGSYGAARQYFDKDIIQAREETIEFVRYSLSKRKNPLLNAIDEMTASNSRPETIQWLRLLQSWLRDATLSRASVSVPVLSDADTKSLENFIKNFPQANLEEAQYAVERAIAQVDKNGYLPLVLVNLSIELKKTLSEIHEL